MKEKLARRDFLAAGLALPVAGIAANVTSSIQEKPASKKPSDPKLAYRVLGKTGLKVTTVGFGCMVTSDQSVIEKAADLGINFFDSARVYSRGNNERMVGAALKSKRKDVIICTKSMSSAKAEAMANLETSLKELGTDYIDIWHLHGKSSAGEITNDWLEVQAQAKKDGKIRFSGISVHNGHANIIPAMIKNANQIDVLLTSYNFSMPPEIEQGIIAASKAGLGIVAMKVMAGGFRRPRGGETTQEILKREGAMLAALKWVIKNKNVSTTIPSITDMEQLEENIEAMGSPFSEADQKTLTAQLDYIRPLYCRMCDECSGKCPKGVPVSDVLRHLAYAEGYGEFELGRENFLELPTEVRNVRCDLCPVCTINCPNGVRVAERLKQAQEWFA
jgi:hypothetical protein